MCGMNSWGYGCMDGKCCYVYVVLCLCGDLACVMRNVDGIMNCMNGWQAIWFIASGWRLITTFTYGHCIFGSGDNVAFVIRMHETKVFAL
jgi:hypothetical protein